MFLITEYKLKVHVSEDDEGKPLQISHSPVMSAEESHRVGLAIKVSLQISHSPVMSAEESHRINLAIKVCFKSYLFLRLRNLRK